MKLFVYGTLKRGFANHDRYCRDAIDIQPATTWGRLHQLPAGFPALVVPESGILAHGTTDPLADAVTQARFATLRSDLTLPSGDWDLIQGELVTLPEPERTLPAIDHLEGFHPTAGSFYRRVLISIMLDSKALPAWVYLGDRVLINEKGIRCLEF